MLANISEIEISTEPRAIFKIQIAITAKAPVMKSADVRAAVFLCITAAPFPIV